MAFKEVNNITYDIHLDEESQAEVVRQNEECLEHYKANNDKLTKFYEGATVAAVAIFAVGMFWDPICDTAKAGFTKAKDFVSTKIFKKPNDNTPDEDGVIDGEFTEVKED